MQPIYKGILMLIRSAITEEKVELPAGFSLDEAYKIIKSQQIENLIYSGVVRHGGMDNSAVIKDMFQRNCYFLHQDHRQRQALQNLYAAFEDNGIDYMPVKGCNMKLLYPQPSMRIMCDADILIRMEQYEKIKGIMLQLGYTEGAVSGHELHWDNTALHLELHKWLMHPDHQDYFKYLTDCWQYAHVQSGHRYELNQEDEWIYTFIHYAKHYRMGGIGIRQVLDLWIYQKKKQLDMEYIRTELQKIDLLEFFENTQRMIGVWFEDQEEDAHTAFMTEYIFSDGSWATGENFDVAYASLQSAQVGSLKKGRYKRIWQTLFPKIEWMEKRYQVLKRVPWLLPIFWPVRWIDTVLFRKENIRKVRKRFQNATDEKVTSFQASLQYVGLNYDFGKE